MSAAAVAAGSGRALPPPGHVSLSTQVAVLARRSVVRTLRQPAQIVPALVFPSFLLAVNAGGLAAATKLPGFPTDSYLDFAWAIMFMQGALFALTGAGKDLATDIQTGFLNRLSLTPLRAPALLAGLLAGVVALALIEAAFYLAVGLTAGATFAAGVGGALVLVALMIVIALAFGSVGAWLALRTGSGEAVEGMFPLVFVLLFLSSMSLPRDLIQQDWFRTVATWNPVSYLIEGMRSVIITGWDGEALGLAFGIGAAVFVVGITLASRSMKTRLVRT
ncbi:MAG: ABC transporter permease [Solirubrobacteraceae bacterium]